MKLDSRSGPPTAREWLLVTTGYTASTVILTYPVAFGISHHFMGDGRDGFQNIWNFWWVRHALTSFQNPYWTDYLFHPTGAPLHFHTLNLLNALLSIPLQWFCNMETTFNLVALFTFVASGVGMYALTRHLTGHSGAAFAAGFVFAFCPYRMGHALGHLNLMSTEWIPVYGLCFLRTLQAPTRGNVLRAALALTLCWFCSEYYVLYSMIFVVLYLLFQRGTFACVRATALSVALFLVATSWVWIPMLVVRSTERFAENIHDPRKWSADVLSFFVPGELSTWGPAFKTVWTHFSGNTAEGSMYSGFVLLTLALFALVRIPASRIWGACALAFIVLALGPRLRLAGTTLPIPMPYALLHKLPLMEMSGMPQRFDAMVMFCLAVCAAFAVRHLVAAPARKPLARLRTACVILALALEYLSIPYPTSQVRVSPFYRQLAQETGDFAVMDTPFSSVTMYLQTIHGKRLVDGYISRAPERSMRFVRETPTINYLSMVQANEPAGDPAGLAEQLRQECARQRIRYVVTHTSHGRGLLDRLGIPVAFEDEEIRVYRTIR